jgi:predicted membrane chloride channel (bestrophin family)
MITDAIDSVSDQLPGPILISTEAQLREMIADGQSCFRIVGTPMPFAYIVHLRWGEGGCVV